MWRGRGSSVESLLELRGGPRLDEAQADFRLLASSHTRLEKKHHIGVCSFVPKSPAAHRRRWSGSCHVLSRFRSILRIACMPEIVECLGRAEAASERTDPATQAPNGPLSGLAQVRLEFAERHLDRIQVR